MCNACFSEDTRFILHDRCINLLYKPAILYFKNSNIYVLRDSRGIIIRFEIKNPEKEYYNISYETSENIKKVVSFLAKIKNAVIIEVHTAKTNAGWNNLKNWEIASVIAGNIESEVRNTRKLSNMRIHSVGYGEFLPENNTPNNGGKHPNRVDIIILCNISGE